MPRGPLLACASLLLLDPASAGSFCGDWQAEIVAVEGDVELQRANVPRWLPATANDTLCTGDSLRVLEFGGATVRLPDATVFTVAANTSFTFPEPKDQTRSWVDLVRGIIHIISRDPRALKFSTPYANAGLEGTEFSIAVTDQRTSVTVLEGEVVMSNAAGTAHISSGERGTAGAGQDPRVEQIEDAVATIDWTSYYPMLLDGELPRADEAPPASRRNDASFYAARAARRLRYGQAAEAAADLERADQLAPRDPTVLALRAIIAGRAGDLESALELATSAVELGPGMAAPHIGLAHVRQLHGDTQGARQSLLLATAAEPANATAWARLAELHLSTGDFESAISAAERALALNPELGYADSVLGFAHLRQLDPTKATAAFERAAARDPADPLPRLGTALASIQRGDLEAARQQLEIAVILDPTNSLARSYMAKTYGAEHRVSLTESQLELAKALDPRDPTPWFYDALNRQEGNDLVAALQSLRTASDLSGEAAPYRSRLMLDEDLGSRSAAWGRVYREVGFEELALRRGWQSSLLHPRDYAPHRLLADVYSTLPRHEIARVNELFQSQLLQPINVTPIQPQLAEASRFTAEALGPTDLAFDEFWDTLTKNGLSIRTSGTMADEGTSAGNIVVAGLQDRLSYSVGHFAFQTDGFRPNNDLDQSVSNAFIQYRANHNTSVQAELRSTTADAGDLRMRFDPSAFIPTFRLDEEVESARLGARTILSGRSTLLASIQYQDVFTRTSSSLFSVDSKSDGFAAEVAYIHSGERWQLTTGVLLLDQDRSDETRLTEGVPPPPGFSDAASSFDVHQTSPYLYATWDGPKGLDVTIGASVDSVEGLDLDEQELNPKLGLFWRATDRTTLRAAAFRTLQGAFVSRRNLQPRLEPVHVAGFNQFFFGSEGELAERYGVGVDHEFSSTVFGGLEVSERRIERPVTIPAGPIAATSAKSEEQSRRGYLYWIASPRATVAAQYHYDSFEDDGQLLNGFSSMKIERLPIELHYFHGSGLSFAVSGTYARQEGYFAESVVTLPDTPTVYGADSFWTFDASLAYRLPNRRGVVSLNVANLFDEDFRFQDVDPENPEFLPDRMVYLRFTLAFD